MIARQLPYKNSVISYIRIGEGPRLALCFPGYGEHATAFQFLEKYADEYRFLAIDLPFHGQTRWQDGLDFSAADLEHIIHDILQVENASPAGNETGITLVGFSLGGRMALRYYQANPGMVKKLVLLAPDGLKLNFWYWLATQTFFGKKLFAFTMKHPGWFFRLLRGLNSLGWVNSSIFKFVKYYIGDQQARLVLYQRWIGFRKIKPSLPVIKSLVHQHHTSVRLVYGKHDRIILPSVGQRFRKGIEAHCSITVIPSGHQVLHEKHTEEILAALRL